MEYTIMIWAKSTSETFGKSVQYLFYIDDSISCFTNADSKLICESTNSCEKLQVDAKAIDIGRWFHVTVSGLPSENESYLRTDYNDQELDMV